MFLRECLVTFFLMINISCAQADDYLRNPNLKLCYILDGILILYGIILTVLYCRLRMQPLVPKSKDKDSEKQAHATGIYQDLAPHREDAYETIKMDKK